MVFRIKKHFTGLSPENAPRDLGYFIDSTQINLNALTRPKDLYRTSNEVSNQRNPDRSFHKKLMTPRLIGA
ncbi:hypothetical protein A7D01_15575 [Xanthomonas arboricola]|nr:hypothetical protein A7D01_15575 [Xanthomonas arboricola]